MLFILSSLCWLEYGYHGWTQGASRNDEVESHVLKMAERKGGKTLDP